MLKLSFDFIISLFLIVIFFPLYVIIASLIYLTNGRPIFFKQLRPGLRENPFYIYKFTTMSNDVDTSGRLLPDERRINSLGHFLRKTSLDEIPSLVNVIKGDMSIVGPRPLLMEYLPLYNNEQRKRHEVKPGITGLAQVKGRNSISWEEKFQLDIEYVNNKSFFLDLKILLLTVIVVFKQKDINSQNHATMEKFQGNKR